MSAYSQEATCCQSVKDLDNRWIARWATKRGAIVYRGVVAAHIGGNGQGLLVEGEKDQECLERRILFIAWATKRSWDTYASGPPRNVLNSLAVTSRRIATFLTVDVDLGL